MLELLLERKKKEYSSFVPTAENQNSKQPVDLAMPVIIAVLPRQ